MTIAHHQFLFLRVSLSSLKILRDQLLLDDLFWSYLFYLITKAAATLEE